jgi:hypothetical protein
MMSVAANRLATPVEKVKPETENVATVLARLEGATDASVVDKGSDLSNPCAAELGR